MCTYSKNLLFEVKSQIESIHIANAEPLEYCRYATKILIVALDALKKYYSNYQFDNQNEEILFFKHIKPQFMYKLIYYNDIYNIEISRPYGSDKEIRKFYNLELSKLKNFFDQYIDFHRYYRSGSEYLDYKYFIRGQHDIQLTLDYCYIQEDHSFTTSHDSKVARIMANDVLQLYLQTEISKLQPIEFAIKDRRSCTTIQKWTGSKVALVELIYALHSEGVFNNGSSDLKDVATFFERALNIDLGQFHRTFLEIRMRKSERTKFLNSLRSSVLQRMDQVDDR